MSIKPPKCKETLILADDYGDNPCTFHCDLPSHHAQKYHKEEGVSDDGSKYKMVWKLKVKAKSE